MLEVGASGSSASLDIRNALVDCTFLSKTLKKFYIVMITIFQCPLHFLSSIISLKATIQPVDAGGTPTVKGVDGLLFKGDKIWILL